MNYVGISGWTYPPWRGVFYPKGLAQRRELEFASREFRSIEINGTHYSLQRPESCERWYDETPEDFVVSVKGNRFITHIRRLKDCGEPLANFFASGLLALREKLGPILWQVPPSLKFDSEVLEELLKLLPHDTTEATKLATKHGSQTSGRSWMRKTEKRTIRHSLEVRNESFMVPKFFELLRKYHVAFVFADTAGKWPYREDVTSDFIYIRLHGDSELYVSGYTEEAIDRWAKRVCRWAAGGQPRDAKIATPRSEAGRAKKDVFVYFDNDAKVKAPRDAKRLAAKV
jgi:uncharacterized protein YecE (DUF72 family)